MENQAWHPIRVVERDTGIARDTLRVWERRYGFPRPERNEQGERVYSTDQVRRLQRIRRLLDQGMRPGKLLALDEPGLVALETELSERHPPPDGNCAPLIEAVLNVDRPALVAQLSARYEQQDLRQFILQTVAPLTQAIGDQWASGQLQIYHEHFATAVVSTFLDAAMTSLPVPAAGPPVLLTTLPGEKHTLGLMMVATLLIDRGKSAVYLGAELPMDQVLTAVHQFRADTVGLTFSASYTYKHIRTHLQELQQQLPSGVAIWIGGEGAHPLRKLPPGVSKFSQLTDLPLG